MVTGVNSILELIGNTPLVKINSMNKNKNVEIFAKLEGYNPSGSIKDRIAIAMIQEAEKTGELTHEKTIIEPTSGNTGIALAMIGNLLGYKVTIVLPESVSIERRKIIKAYGAKLILTDKNKGTDGAIIKTEEIVAKNPKQYFFPNQFKNRYNPISHYRTTAREIILQTCGKIDAFVASIGTSGTLMGVSTYLKEHNPNIKIISAEPGIGHKIQGLKNMSEAIVPDIFDAQKICQRITVTDKDAFDTARMLAKEEGIFAGMSSGAALWVALEYAKKLESGRIVTIFPDRGEKYLSTELFE